MADRRARCAVEAVSASAAGVVATHARKGTRIGEEASWTR